MNDLLDGIDLDIDSRSDLFAGIIKNQQADIFNAGQRRLMPLGETLFREGDRASRCYFVQNGRLKLTKLHKEGKEAIVRYINPGEITAAVAVFRGKRYPVTAVTVVPTAVIGWDRDTILKLLSAHPPLAINFLQAAVERLDDIQTRYLELQAERVERRIGHALLRIMRQSGRKIDTGILIDFPLSRQDLADYTGTTLYTVSRTLSRWEKLGWIASGREKVVVTDPHALVAFAETG